MANSKVENKTNKEDKISKEENKMAEKKIKVRIPLDPLNPKDKEIIIGINEKYAKVVRGEDTEVTISVYEQLRNAGLV